MKINIGSTNEIKIDAVREVIADYDFLSGARINGTKVSSGVSEQPKSLSTTIKGAKNRALGAFHECDYRFTTEEGFI